MKKKITFEKTIEFPTMIGEITAISLEENLKFIDESNIDGNLLLIGKYKMTEASRLETDFSYEIPTEIVLSEKIDINTSNIEITDFNYEVEDENLICHIELEVNGLEILEEAINSEEDRECDGDMTIEKEIEIPMIENEVEKEEREEVKEDVKSINSLFSNLDDENDTYGTLLVYIV